MHRRGTFTRSRVAVAFHVGGELRGRQWTTEKIALAGNAAVLFQQVAPAGRLDAFRDHRQTQNLAQRHHSAGDGRVVGDVGVDQHVAHERLVDLQRVQRQ